MNGSASTVSFPRRRMSSSDAPMSSVFHVLKSVELSRTASAHTSEVLQLVRRSAASIKHSRPWPKHAKIVGRGCVSSSKTCERSCSGAMLVPKWSWWPAVHHLFGFFAQTAQRLLCLQIHGFQSESNASLYVAQHQSNRVHRLWHLPRHPMLGPHILIAADVTRHSPSLPHEVRLRHLRVDVELAR